MSMEFVEASRYKKLEMALLSGLPNEVDFAMNACTLLSNKGRHTLQLRETPRLLELLLGHVGIYRDGESRPQGDVGLEAVKTRLSPYFVEIIIIIKLFFYSANSRMAHRCAVQDI